jgi:hypothetical protein
VTKSCADAARVAGLSTVDVEREVRIDALRARWVGGRTAYARRMALKEMRREIAARSAAAREILGAGEWAGR